MKIVHVITELNDGGAEGVLFRLCSLDINHKHVVISMMDEGKYGPLLEKAGITVECLGMQKGKLSAKGVYRLWKIIRKEKPDVVQTWMYHADLIGGIAAKLAGVPRICWGIRHSTLDKQRSTRTTLYIARACAMLSCFIPDRIICCAESAAEVHEKLGYSQKKLVVIPNGYDLDRFQPSSQKREDYRKEIGIPDSTPLIGMVGRYNPQKDHRTLLQAIRLVKNRKLSFNVALVGPGMHNKNHDVLATLKEFELEDIVMLLGPSSDVGKVMNGLDLHVLSSAYGEAFPNVVAEAMACATPCVVTDVGDAAAIAGGLGWVVPPEQATALAEAIYQALVEAQKDLGAWHARKINCTERVRQHFSMQSMIENFNREWSDQILQSPTN